MFYYGNKQIGSIYYENKKINSIYYGGKKVFSSGYPKGTVFTAYKNGTEARFPVYNVSFSLSKVSSGSTLKILTQSDYYETDISKFNIVLNIKKTDFKDGVVAPLEIHGWGGITSQTAKIDISEVAENSYKIRFTVNSSGHHLVFFARTITIV